GAGRQKLRRKQLSEGDATYWYSSAVDSTLPLAPTPPTTSTFPFPSNVAVCQERAVVISPVYVKVILVGLNSSALAKGVTDVCGSELSTNERTLAPPAISTSPSPSRVAVRSEERRVGKECRSLGAA